MQRISAVFVRMNDRFLDLAVPYFALAFSLAFLKSFVFPYLFSGTLLSALTFVSVIVSIVLGAVLYCGLVAAFVRPGFSAPDKVSADSVAEFLTKSWGILVKSLPTYWSLVKYVVLIPLAAILVAFFVFGMGSGITAATISVAIFFLVYRMVRATFALIYAVDHDDYGTASFEAALGLTDGLWWSVFGNFFVVGLLSFLAAGILGYVASRIGIDPDGRFFLLAQEASQILFSLFTTFFLYELYRDYRKDSDLSKNGPEART